jgi:pimeloyl-ACP methyl ester carboxylesterase
MRAAMSRPPFEPALLLHGQPGSAADWDRVCAAMGERTALLAIDRPGWSPGTAATGMTGNADAALTALERAGARRATVVGHSFGAAVAAWLAAEHPERVTRLVLISPAVNEASLVPLDRWLARPGLGELVGAPLLGGFGAALSLAPLRRRLAHAFDLEDRYLERMAARIRTPAAWLSFAAEQRVLVREMPEIEARLPAIEAPTTVLVGSRDRVVPPEAAAAAAAAIPGAEFAMVDGAGHLLLQYQPRAVAETIVG